MMYAGVNTLILYFT